MRYTSIAQWATDIGSTAKTYAGQLRAIRGHIAGAPHDPVADGNIIRIDKRKSEYRVYIYNRIERSADGRAKILGYPPESQAYSDYCEAYHIDTQIDAWDTQKTITISDAIARTYRAAWNEPHTTIDLGHGYRAIVTWNEDADWHYYAKSYGRPKNTYSNRRVDIYNRVEGKMLTIPVDRFSGDFLHDAIITAGKKLQLSWLTPDNIPTREQIIEKENQKPLNGRTKYSIGDITTWPFTTKTLGEK